MTPLFFLAAQGSGLWTAVAGLPAWMKLIAVLVTGGGLAKLLEAVGKVVNGYLRADSERDQQEFTQDMDLRTRMYAVERKLDTEIECRREAQRQSAKVERKLDAVVHKLDTAVAAITRLLALLNDEREEAGKEPLRGDALQELMPYWWEEHTPRTASGAETTSTNETTT